MLALHPPPFHDGGYADLALSRYRAHSSAMRWTCLPLVLIVLIFSPARAGSDPPRVTLRVHVQTTGEGLSAQQASPITIPPDGEQIQVRTLPETSERDLIDVEQDAAGLHLQFNHVGTVNLNAVTAQNQGRILVVMVDGRVIYAPIIDAQINTGRLTIPHQLPPEIVALLHTLAQKNLAESQRS